MSLLLDTDTIVEVLRKNPKAVTRLAATDVEVILGASAITAAELYHGAAVSREAVRNTTEVAEVLAQLTVVPVDEAVAVRFGTLKANLQAAGQIIPDFDLLIAATALVHGLTVVTHNTRHFARIPDLTVDDWLA